MLIDQESKRIQQIRNNLETYDTEYLENIWETNDQCEWSPETFEAIRQILLERIGSVPVQKTRDPRKNLEPQEGKPGLFLTHFDGLIVFPSLDAEDTCRILDHLRSALIDQKASNVQLSTNKITFQVAFFSFVSNWNILEMVDKGEIFAHPGASGSLKYSFSFKRIFMSSTLFSVALLLFLLFVGRQNILTIIRIPIISWLWLYGLNYIIVAFRLQGFIRQAISDK
jgi:hypothetical protein